MEPLAPLLSKSPNQVRHQSSWVPEDTPVNWLQQDLDTERQGFEEEWWPVCFSNPSNPINPSSKRTTRRAIPTSRWTSTFESVFADGGLSIRMQHHPLHSSTTEEEEGSGSGSGSGSDVSQDLRTRDPISVSPEIEESAESVNVIDASTEGFARMLPHSESVESEEPGEPTSPQIEGTSAIPSDELGIEPPPELPDFKGVPIVRKSKLGGEALAEVANLPSWSPSPSSPVMERTEALAASLESTDSWIQPKLATRDVHREVPVAEERDLRYSMPKGDELLQEDLSFRLWKREETSQDEQDRVVVDDASARNGFPTLNSGGDDELLKKQQSPPNVDALVNLRALNLRSRRRGAAMIRVEVESEQGYPSPSSSTWGLSPTSLFSDDQEPFRLIGSGSSDDDMCPAFQLVRSRGGSREEIRTVFRKSPRSVLSQELGEISHETSDSSEVSGKKPNQKPPHNPPHKPPPTSSPAFPYFYDDESSDLESPMHAKCRRQVHQPFPAFTYSVGQDMMGSTSASASSSSSEADESDSGGVAAGSLRELGLFQEANDWLVDDGGVLDDSEDLEFLLSSDFKCVDTGEMGPVFLEENSPLRSRQLRIGFPSLVESPASGEMTESMDARTNHERSRSKDDSPKSRHDSPKTRRGSPKTKPDSPKTQHESPKTERESPKIKYGSPNTKHAGPETRQGSPNLKHDTPNLKQDVPKTKQDIPETKEDRPKLTHDSLRRPTSGTKWVPYVTSNLDGNNPPRVRNRARGGLQQQNPNLDKTTYQGIKASVTESCTDKTPKRTVNFAPDLVKEILYSQSKTPATARATTSASTQDRKQQQQHPLRENPKTKKGGAADTDPFVAPASKVKSKTSEVEDEAEAAAAAAAAAAAGGVGEDDGPSIMNSRRRWRRNRDDGGDDDRANKSSSTRGGSTSWRSFSESRFFRYRERAGVPSCVGRLVSWPRRFAVKVKSSRIVDSDDDEYGAGGQGERSFGGDRSFGNSSRRDAELVRRILKGSHKKYSNLTGEDILKYGSG